MDNNLHLVRLKNSCLAANISQFLEREINIEEPGRARLSIPFNEQLTQNANFLHGAVLFEMADTAGFVAANSIERTHSVLTVDYHINFLRPVQREGIYAVGEVINVGKRLIVAQSRVYTESDKLVAVGQGTYAISNILLSEVEAYVDTV